MDIQGETIADVLKLHALKKNPRKLPSLISSQVVIL